MSDFVHLHCHSEYSIKSSTIRINALVKQAKALGFSALALTDCNNFFAAIKFYQAAISVGIKPIFGAELTLLDNNDNPYQAIFLSQNDHGYQNLCMLISEGYLHHQFLGEVRYPQTLVKKYSAGLIMIATARQSDISRLLNDNNYANAQEKVRFWQKIFPDRYYLAIERLGRSGEEHYIALCTQLAAEENLPVVASNTVEFLATSDFEAHEVRACIASGDLLDDDRRAVIYSKEQYLKSAQQMCDLFADLKEALANTVQIAKRCNVQFSVYQKHYLPNFPTPKGMSIAELFSKKSRQGLKARFLDSKVDGALYQSRLNYEISVIIKMDFPGYFLIVADFIAYAKKHGIAVGPGRGSGAGSLVAYALGITNVDPIKHDLLFERFLNPERISMPDFDIDFCAQRRDEVITYVAQKYGQGKVSQIVTHGTMAAKGVIRDVVRVLGHPYGFGDRLAKMVSNDLKITLSRALGRFEDKDKQEDKDKWLSIELLKAYDTDKSTKTVLDIALQLEGLARNVGTHAGGVVIAPSQISDFCPIYKGSSQDDSIVSQFDMDDLEAVGLVKFDFLGLSNLTVIDKTLDALVRQKASAHRIDIDYLPLDDKKVYQLLQAGNTTGIFQLESEGMRQYLKDLQADCFADIVAMLALYRPGPLESGMVEDYIAIKHKKKPISYPHKMLEPVLKPTNGGFLYQEQVMQAAQVMADYSLGAADILRRAMGKKKPEEMKKQRGVFVSGALKKGIEKKQANHIFDLIDKFSGYGFNKSHSVAYALVSYQTAYLKAHYPAFFMASLLSGVMDNSDRVAFIITEVRRMNIIVTPPNIQFSDYEFTVQNNCIVYGLGAIKGVGKSLVATIISKRQADLYQDFIDFCCRIDKTLLNRRALEALILAGVFDIIVKNRHELINTFTQAVKYAEQYQKDKASGQAGLFNNASATLSYKDIAVPSALWTPLLQLYEEKRVLGYFFSAHPTDFYQNMAKQLKLKIISAIKKRNNYSIATFGLVVNLNMQENKNGYQAIFNLCDNKETLFVIMSIKNEKDLAIKNNQVVYLSGTLRESYNKDNWRIFAEKVIAFEDFYWQCARKITLNLCKHHKENFMQIAKTINKHRGDMPLDICYQTNQTKGILNAARIKPNATLKYDLERLLDKKLIITEFAK